VFSLISSQSSVLADSFSGRDAGLRGVNHRLRVIAGRLSGRRFRVPQGEVRPTSDRVREALFGRLGNLDGVRVLDLYAGSGALGIEAISRGAAEATFVEKEARALGVLRANLAALGIDPIASVIPGDVPAVVRRLGRAKERFDLVLIDPPYASEEPTRAFEALVGAAVLSPDAMLVLERDRRHPSPKVEGLAEVDERRYGDTVVARFVATRTE
jgi:16S rRNA (guanine966-N2)-methyltransferase